jgi:hypothetical protein
MICEDLDVYIMKFCSYEHRKEFRLVCPDWDKYFKKYFEYDFTNYIKKRHKKLQILCYLPNIYNVRDKNIMDRAKKTQCVLNEITTFGFKYEKYAVHEYIVNYLTKSLTITGNYIIYLQHITMLTEQNKIRDALNFIKPLTDKFNKYVQNPPFIEYFIMSALQQNMLDLTDRCRGTRLILSYVRDYLEDNKDEKKLFIMLTVLIKNNCIDMFKHVFPQKYIFEIKHIYNKKFKYTLALYCIKHNNPEALKHILNCYIDQSQSQYGGLIIKYANEMGNLEIIQILKKHKN